MKRLVPRTCPWAENIKKKKEEEEEEEEEKEEEEASCAMIFTVTRIFS